MLNQQEVTSEKALDIIYRALDTIQADGPTRRAIDQAYAKVHDVVAAYEQEKLQPLNDGDKKPGVV
jgi:hypothetical protein